MRATTLAMLLIAALIGALPRAAQAQQTAPKPTAAQDGFVPVETLQPQEQLPAAGLVMTAYAVAWVASFGFLWSIWRRLDRVEREMVSVSRRLEPGARR